MKVLGRWPLSNSPLRIFYESLGTGRSPVAELRFSGRPLDSECQLLHRGLMEARVMQQGSTRGSLRRVVPRQTGDPARTCLLRDNQQRFTAWDRVQTHCSSNTVYRYNTLSV